MYVVAKTFPVLEGVTLSTLSTPRAARLAVVVALWVASSRDQNLESPLHFQEWRRLVVRWGRDLCPHSVECVRGF